MNDSAAIYGVTVKLATKEDVPLILTLLKEFSEYVKIGEVTATEDILTETMFGDRPYAEAAIAYVDGNPAGIATLQTNFATFLGRPGIYLEDLYVRQDMRRQKVGSALMVYLARLAKQRNCDRVEWLALDWNQPSLDFYEQLGAKAMHKATVYRFDRDAIERVSLYD